MKTMTGNVPTPVRFAIERRRYAEVSLYGFERLASDERCFVLTRTHLDHNGSHELRAHRVKYR